MQMNARTCSVNAVAASLLFPPLRTSGEDRSSVGTSRPTVMPPLNVIICLLSPRLASCQIRIQIQIQIWLSTIRCNHLFASPSKARAEVAMYYPIKFSKNVVQNLQFLVECKTCQVTRNCDALVVLTITSDHSQQPPLPLTVLLALPRWSRREAIENALDWGWEERHQWESIGDDCEP